MYRVFELEIKSVETEPDSGVGTFSGHVSVFNIPDYYNEVVVPGAFDESVKQHNGIFPLLWQHDTAEPIGLFNASTDEKGLAVQGRICLGTQKGQEAYALLKMRDQMGISPIQGMSIGYITRKDEYQEDGLRLLQDIDLWEGSFVTFPAHKDATIDEVKSRASLEEALRIIARADPKDLAGLDIKHIRMARNKLDRIPEPIDDVDRIAEFVANEVKGWTQKK